MCNFPIDNVIPILGLPRSVDSLWLSFALISRPFQAFFIPTVNYEDSLAHYFSYNVTQEFTCFLAEMYACLLSDCFFLTICICRLFVQRMWSREWTFTPRFAPNLIFEPVANKKNYILATIIVSHLLLSTKSGSNTYAVNSWFLF